MAKKMFKIGEKPGAGTYECVSCKANWKIVLESTSRFLPAALVVKKQNVRYKKVG